MSKLEQLWMAIKNAPTKKDKEAIIDKLDAETIIALKAISNPYRKPIYEGKDNFANVSIINTTREYDKNLMMTSFVAFFYKMALEFKHPSAESFPSEYEGELGNEIAKMKRRVGILKPEAFYRAVYEKSQLPLDYAIWQRSRERMFEKLLEDFAREYKTKKEKKEELEKTKTALEENNETEQDLYGKVSADLVKAAAEFAEADKLAYEYKAELDKAKACGEVAKKKHNLNENEIVVREVQLDDVDTAEINKRAKEKLGISVTKEEKETEIQDYLLDFLDYHLRYDPNNHIRAGYQPLYDPVIREKIKRNPEKFEYSEDGKMIITDKFAEYIVPPADTFGAFRTYFDSNYEYLRQCTDDIYGKLDSFEWGTIVYETFKTEQQAAAWLDKYRKDVQCEVFTVKMMNWIFLDSFAQNRNKMRGADDKMRLIDMIREKNTQDEKLAQNLMKKKVRKMPGRAGSGPMTANKELEDLGVSKVDDLEDGREAAEDEIEVKVYSTKMKKVGRRFIQVQDQFRFNIDAEKPENAVKLSAGELEELKMKNQK